MSGIQQNENHKNYVGMFFGGKYLVSKGYPLLALRFKFYVGLGILQETTKMSQSALRIRRIIYN